VCIYIKKATELSSQTPLAMQGASKKKKRNDKLGLRICYSEEVEHSCPVFFFNYYFKASTENGTNK